MPKKLCLILGLIFVLDSLVFSFANVGKVTEWTYPFFPKFNVDNGMMLAFMSFYNVVAGYLIGLFFYKNTKN